MKGGDIMRISEEEFRKYAYDPDWYIESWTGHTLGPGNYKEYLDEEGMIDCNIAEEIKTILVY